jgi:hypothetical protein
LQNYYQAKLDTANKTLTDAQAILDAKQAIANDAQAAANANPANTDLANAAARAQNTVDSMAPYVSDLQSKVAAATQALDAAQTAAVTDGALAKGLENACFTGDTLVWTELGPWEIQYVDVGVKVLSRNELTGEMSFRPVVEQFVHENKHVYDVCFFTENGSGAIAATAEHPFWVIGQGWTAVRDLKPGHVIMTCNGSRYIKDLKGSDFRLSKKINQIYETSTVTIMEISDRNITTGYVFNLNVEAFHTYFVADYGLWVHNCNNDTAKNPRPTVSILEATPENTKIYENLRKSTKIYENLQNLGSGLA